VQRRRRINPVVADFIRDNAATFTPKELIEQLAHRPELAVLGIPSLRSIQSLVSEHRRDPKPTPNAQDWLVLPVVGWLAERSGRWPILAPEVSDRIAQLRRDFPSLPVAEAHVLARADDARLAPYLAFEPWQDDGERYIAAYGRGLFGRLILTGSTEPAFRRWAERKKAAGAEAPTA
jgi:hypothetical protein